MKSFLFRDDLDQFFPFNEPPECVPCRQELQITLRSNGRIYKFTARDKIVIEDPFLVLVKAGAFAIREGEPYNGKTMPRSIRDFLIKSSVVI